PASSLPWVLASVWSRGRSPGRGLGGRTRRRPPAGSQTEPVLSREDLIVIGSAILPRQHGPPPPHLQDRRARRPLLGARRGVRAAALVGPRRADDGRRLARLHRLAPPPPRHRHRLAARPRHLLDRPAADPQLAHPRGARPPPRPSRAANGRKGSRLPLRPPL